MEQVQDQSHSHSVELPQSSATEPKSPEGGKDWPLQNRNESQRACADASIQLSPPEYQSIAQSLMRVEGKLDEILHNQRPTTETSSLTPPQLPRMLQPQQPSMEQLGDELLQILMNPPTANQHQISQTGLGSSSGPSYSTPPGPSYSNPPPGPSYSTSPPGPSYFTSPPGPSYSTSPHGPSYSTSPPGPSYSTPPLGPSYSSPQMRYGLSESGLSNPTQPNSHSGTGPYGLDHPEKFLSKFPGNDISSLRNLTVELARYVVFGEEVLARSTPVRGPNQLDPNKLKYINTIIRNRAESRSDNELFRLVWQKCLEKLGRTCRKLRLKANAK